MTEHILKIIFVLKVFPQGPYISILLAQNGLIRLRKFHLCVPNFQELNYLKEMMAKNTSPHYKPLNLTTDERNSFCIIAN